MDDGSSTSVFLDASSDIPAFADDVVPSLCVDKYIATRFRRPALDVIDGRGNRVNNNIGECDGLRYRSEIRLRRTSELH